MRSEPHLTVVIDRNRKLTGYYRCWLCEAEFRPNPDNLGEMMTTFAQHVGSAHKPKKPREDLSQADQRIARLLNIPNGSPLLRIRQLIFSTNGRAALYVAGLYRSGRHTLRIRRFR